MTCPSHSASVCYELRIQGHLDEHWSSWFGGLTITHDDDGTTTLRGPVTDQSALHGLLAKIRDLGIPLLSVTCSTPRPGNAETGRQPLDSAQCDSS